MTLIEPPDTVDAEVIATRPPWRRRIITVLVTIAVMALGGWLVLQWLTPHPYSGTVMQAPTAAPSMDGLVWDDGTPVDVTELGGELVLVYFGYTSCPDVCPTTLVSVDRALDRLGDDVDRVQVLMVSIDPERDDPERVGGYVRSFDPAFRGVSGSVEAVERVASTYGIFFAQDEPLEGGGYTMSHTSTLLGIDPDGHLRIVWPSVLDPDSLAADISELL
ncbi:SCO family protein [Ilumatobacter sp.]|uniref:SCO family protein n=1 Tax=Ilumatobacter sp. TaxID=1967498 RepID=UPI003AF63711